MDFSTIKNQMEVKDGTGYKHVREIYADVRLVFKNAMKYNDEKSDVHAMAKALLEKFEEKWLQFLPKVSEEVTKVLCSPHPLLSFGSNHKCFRLWLNCMWK